MVWMLLKKIIMNNTLPILIEMQLYYIIIKLKLMSNFYAYLSFRKKIYESYQKLVKKIRKVNKNLKFGKNDLSKHSRPPVKLPGIPCI